MAQSVFNGLLGALLSNATIIGVGAGNQVLSASDYSGDDVFMVTGADSDERIVTVPPIDHTSIWQGDPENDYSVSVQVGTGSVSIAPGQVVTIVTDGSANGIGASELTGSISTLAWQAITAADSPFQAKAGDHLDIDSSGGAVTVLLPAAPQMFDEVWLSNLKGTLAAHTLTVTPGEGDTIADDAGLTASTNGAEFSLRFDGATNWTFQLEQ